MRIISLGWDWWVMVSPNTKEGRNREWRVTKELPNLARPKLPTNFAASTSRSFQSSTFSENGAHGIRLRQVKWEKFFKASWHRIWFEAGTQWMFPCYLLFVIAISTFTRVVMKLSQRPFLKRMAESQALIDFLGTALPLLISYHYPLSTKRVPSRKFH